MKFLIKDINGKDFSDFLKEFYGKENNPYELADNGSWRLKGFHYTTTNSVDSFNMNSMERFLVVIDEEKSAIVGIVCYWTGSNWYSNEINSKVECMSYLEISSDYQHQGLLKEICNIFVKYIHNEYFVSNSESSQGKQARVNEHLKEAFKSTSTKFFSNESDFLKSLRK